jgi:hypothetical protein
MSVQGRRGSDQVTTRDSQESLDLNPDPNYHQGDGLI